MSAYVVRSKVLGDTRGRDKSKVNNASDRGNNCSETIRVANLSEVRQGPRPMARLSIWISHLKYSS